MAETDDTGGSPGFEPVPDQTDTYIDTSGSNTGDPIAERRTYSPEQGDDNEGTQQLVHTPEYLLSIQTELSMFARLGAGLLGCFAALAIFYAGSKNNWPHEVTAEAAGAALGSTIRAHNITYPWETPFHVFAEKLRQERGIIIRSKIQERLLYLTLDSIPATLIQLLALSGPPGEATTLWTYLFAGITIGYTSRVLLNREIHKLKTKLRF